MYCGYANGVMQYWVAIAAETERYWCDIQHEKGDGFVSPQHHKDFSTYRDKKSFESTEHAR